MVLIYQEEPTFISFYGLAEQAVRLDEAQHILR